MNGNMFSLLSKEGAVCLRLSPDDQATYWASHGGEPVKQYGSVMKGYVALSQAVLDDDGLRASWFERCLAHATRLPAKVTKK